MILCIETSAAFCSIAIASPSGLLALRESKQPNDHASRIVSLIDDCLGQALISIADIEAIVVSLGPGSFTGLRVGISAAKGLSFATRIPIIGISTLKALAHASLKEDDAVPYICSMIKARKDEVYASIFNREGKTILPEGVYTLYDGFHQSVLRGSTEVLFCGDGVERYQEICSGLNLNFRRVPTSATNLIALGLKKHIKKDYSNGENLRPTYLKTPHITSARKVL